MSKLLMDPKTWLVLCLTLSVHLSSIKGDDSLFDQSNLAAWCIVPFDAAKREPEARAAMLERIGIKKFVYDYRKEHISQWDEELLALKRHKIELLGWWFPTTLNDEAKQTLELFKRHGVRPQLWVSGQGGAIDVPNDADQQARITREVERLTPIAKAGNEIGCSIGIYNHGGWYGEPENAIAIVETMKKAGITNVGIVYNFHHGHGHLKRFESVLPKMIPYLLCVNLNGMDVDGESKGRKILPIGVGTEDMHLLKILKESRYRGPIGLLNHTNEDAEGRLLDNLEGLQWTVERLKNQPTPAKPKYRTWNESKS